MNWGDIFVSILGSSTIIGAILLLFKESIKAMLKRSVDTDLARVVHELDLKKEIIKGEISQSAYQTQLMLNNIYTIYPELAEKLERAFSAVNRIVGLTFATDYSQFAREDYVKMFDNSKIPKGKQEDLLAKITADYDKGIEELEKYLANANYGLAKIACAEAMNFRVLKGIYCSDNVLNEFDNAYASMWGAWAKLSTGRSGHPIWNEGAKIIFEESPEKMKTFRKVIRAELRIEAKPSSTS